MKMRHKHRATLKVLAVLAAVPLTFVGCVLFMDYYFHIFHGTLIRDLKSSIASFGPVRLSYSAIVRFDYAVPSEGVTILVPLPTIEGEGIPAFERALAEVEPPPEIVRNEKGTFIKLTEAHARPYAGVGLFLMIELDRSGRQKEFLQREFDLGSAAEDRPGYWVFVDTGGSVRYLLLRIWVKAADGAWIKRMEYRLDEPSDGWHLVEGEVSP
jgi:hypothetical protein